MKDSNYEYEKNFMKNKYGCYLYKPEVVIEPNHKSRIVRVTSTVVKKERT